MFIIIADSRMEVSSICKLKRNIVIESSLKFSQIELKINNNLMILLKKEEKLFVKLFELLEAALSPMNVGRVATQSNSP